MTDALEALRDFHIVLELWGVNDNLKNLRREQWEAASEIVASVDTVHDAVERLESKVEEQTTILRRGFVRVDDRLDFIGFQLDKVVYLQQNPLETRARELRLLGERRLAGGLYSEAIEAFLNSLDLYPDDFTCHYSVAAIQAEHLDDPAAAWDSCENALQFANSFDETPSGPSPSFWRSKTLLMLGELLEEGGELDGAATYYAAACQSSPTYGACFRRYGSVLARLGYKE